MDELGYTSPTPVQRAVFEAAKKGGDMVVQARTGTGKTSAFGLPLVDGLVRPDIAAVQAMVLCPTRELALQVAAEVGHLAKHRGLKVISVYGGAPMQRQIDQIADGAQVLVGTPGRVLDHLRRGTLDPTRIKILVLDESDEMLSMGFLPQINEVLEALPKALQTLLFSATVPREVVRMAEDRLKNPTFITLSGDAVGALEIDHFTYLSAGEKISDLMQLIEVENPESAIIFCNTREQTKRVAAQLKQAGYSADWLNADLSQSDRERVMAAVRSQTLRFLVATDVAARGIDVSHLTHVINFDFPESTEVYVHRTGRTGRAGRTGTAISLISPQDIGGLYMLKLTYRIIPVERSLPSARELRSRAELDLIEGLARLAQAEQPAADDRALARRLLTHDQAELVLALLLRDHLGPRAEAESAARTARVSKAPRPAPNAERREGRRERPERAERREERGEGRGNSRAERPREERGDSRADERGARQREERGERPREERAAKPREADKQADERPRRDREARADRATDEQAAKQREQRADRPREERGERPRRDEHPNRSADERAAKPREERPPREARAERREDRPRDERPRREREARGERAAERHAVNGLAEDDLDLPGYTVSDAPAARAVPARDDERPRRQREPRDHAGAGERPQQERRADGRARERQPEDGGGREPRAAQPSRGGQQSQGAQPRERQPEHAPPSAQEPRAAVSATPPATTPAAAPAPATPAPAAAVSSAAVSSATMTTPAAAPSAGAAEGVRRIHVNVGRKDGARASDFRQALVERGRLNDNDTEQVNVRHDHTLIGVKAAILDRALAALQGATIAGTEAIAQISAT